MLTKLSGKRLRDRAAGMLCAMALGLAALAPLAATPGAWAQDTTRDTVIFTTGQTVEGTILEETATSIRMRVNVAGIEAETTYQKSEILKITRGTGDDAPKTDAKAADPSKIQAKAADPKKSGAAKVYLIELTGTFAEDISQTPIRKAVQDAKRYDVDYIIVTMDNDWSLRKQGNPDEKKDDDSAFDQLFRAEDMAPVFNEEIPREWTKPPTVVFWVKKAMGGAAFLPLNCKTIYFHSEGKMGGIGHLGQLFGSMGDEVVREKQFSLRLGHAEGMAIQGGYDPKIVKAMARDEYVLSVRFEGGRPVFLERMPESLDEMLLTNNGGKDENKDNIQDLARGEGKNVLTLNADLAYKLGVSKGTADTLEDLVFALGIARNYEVVKGQSAQITKGWRDGLESAKRQLPKLWRDFGRVDVKPPGGHRERSQARGRQISIIEEMQGIEKRYEEALNPNRVGVPDWNQLETIKQRIKLEQLADKR